MVILELLAIYLLSLIGMSYNGNIRVVCQISVFHVVFGECHPFLFDGVREDQLFKTRYRYDQPLLPSPLEIYNESVDIKFSAHDMFLE